MKQKDKVQGLWDFCVGVCHPLALEGMENNVHFLVILHYTQTIYEIISMTLKH